jgi:hypothetical protein
VTRTNRMATLDGMQPTKSPAATSVAPLITPWMPGPHDPGEASVVVSVTEFLAHRRRELPGVAAQGWRMRLGWYAMPGAVGLWLWSLPASSRSGSISVWATEGDLDRFVGLPHHVDIMKRYRGRGTVRSTTWDAERFEPAVTLDRARTWISGRAE